MTAPRILVVCLGNICRSPTAEAALREAAAEAGIALDLHSAGTGGWHIGASPDERMCDAAAAVGLRLDGTAEQVDVTAIEAADLVLAMDRSNLRELLDLAASADLDTPIRLFRDFDPDATDRDRDVPDPYYGGPDGFAEVVRIARRTAREIVERVASGELTGRHDGHDASGHPGPR